MNEGKKRIFIILGLGMILGYGLIFTLIWFALSHPSPFLHKVLMIAFVAACVMMMGIMALGLGCLVFTLLAPPKSKGLNKLSRQVVDFFSPAVFKLGKVLGIEREKLQHSYINIVNQMNAAAGEHFRPEDILVLAPHCLQKTDCPHKITIDVRNCHRCGRCSINGLLDICDERGVKLAVATGGTFARKIIREQRPKAVVAIACERDLTSGIQDIQQIPVLGVLNERPNGPCFNTNVQLCKVNQAIDCFCRGDEQ